MNRAWIPAGALAGVSVAGLIALGPLTNSLTQQPLLPVRRDGFRAADAAEGVAGQLHPQGSGRQHRACRLEGQQGRAGSRAERRRRSGRSPDQEASPTDVARDGCAAAGRTREAAEEGQQSARRPSAASAGRTVTPAWQAATRTGRRIVATCRARPAATPPETVQRSGRIGKIGALGAIAQLGERLDRTQEVSGSSPLSSIAAMPLSMRH